jgi:hypothetical protein
MSMRHLPFRAIVPLETPEFDRHSGGRFSLLADN